MLYSIVIVCWSYEKYIDFKIGLYSVCTDYSL